MSWWHLFSGAPKPWRKVVILERAELRFLPYAEADQLIRETQGAWRVVKEEDGRPVDGWMYLERLETK